MLVITTVRKVFVLCFQKRTFKFFVAAIVMSNISIIFRAIYRLIELFKGYHISPEPWTFGLDRALKAVCTAVW